jgi:hypothetical protein
MGWLDVDGGAGPPTFPDNIYSEYYVLDGGTPLPPAAPSDLTATATSSSAIDLEWLDNAGDEDGFYIERSLDGVNFTLLTSEPPFNGMGIVTYTDTNLDPETTYWYRVFAYKTEGGDSDFSNVASATTQASGGGVIMHVENITVVREALNGNRFRGVATITILDGSGETVSGATVNGDFSGSSSSSESGITDSNGQVTFNSRGTKNPVGEWCFEVTDVTLAGSTYDSGVNVVTQACESGIVFNPLQNTNSTDDIHLGVSPNPFQESTQITFRLSQQMHVVLEVYTVLGERVAMITDQNYDTGQHFLEWNAQNLDVGMYFLQVKAGGKLIDTRRLILTR